MRDDPRYTLLRPRRGPDAAQDAQRSPTVMGPAYLASRATTGPQTGSGRSRRSPWPFRVVLGLVALLGLLGGVLAGAPSAVERYALTTLGRLESRFGVEVTAATIEWTWGGTVRATGVRIASSPRSGEVAAETLATIAAVDLELDVSLFDRTARLVSATFDQPRLELVRRPDGSTNVDGILRALRDRRGGTGGSSKLDLAALGTDAVTVKDLEVLLVPSLERDPSVANLGLEIPSRIELHRGKVELSLPAASPADPSARTPGRVALTFADTSLDPGQAFAIELGFAEDGTLSPALGRIGPLGRLQRVAVSPSRPVRFWLGERVVGLGGVALTKDGVELFPLQLSVPVPNRVPTGEVSAAATVGRLVVDLPELGRVLEPNGLSRLRSALSAALSGQGPSPVTRVALGSPVLALALDGGRHSFEDLLALGGAVGAGSAEVPTASAPLPPLEDDLLVSANRAAIGRVLTAKPEATPRPARASNAPMAKALAGLLSGLADKSAAAHELVLRLRDRAHRLVGLAGELEVEDAELALDISGLPLDLRGVDLTVVKAVGDTHTDLVLHVAGESPFAKDHRFSAELRAPLPDAAGLTGPMLWSLTVPAIPLDALGELASRLHLGSRGTVGLVLGARHTATRIELDFDLTFEGVTFSHPSVASAPIPDIHARVEGRLVLDAAAQELSLRELVVRSGQVAVTGELDLVSAFSAPRIKLALDLPETALSDIVAAIPVGLIPLLAGLKMDGHLAWRLGVDLDTTEPAAVKIESQPRARGVRVTSLGERLDLSALRTAHTYTIRLFDGTPGTRVVGPATASWVPLGQITPYLPLALTTTEDGTFYTNDGISTFAMKESIATNLERGTFARGASTITQQLVKNLFLGGDKTVSRKLQEVFIAWQVAQLLSKDEIMALYLNTIEFGPGLYGIGDASWHWFGKRPIDLTLPEAVFLASIVPGPRRYYTFYEQGGITPRWASYLEALMKVMVERKKLTAEELAMNLPVQVRFRGHGGGYTDEAPADFDLVPERDDLLEPSSPDTIPEPQQEDP